MSRTIEKYNMAIVPLQEIDISVAATIIGVTVEEGTLKLLVDQEVAPTRIRKRSFYIVVSGAIIPDEALRYVGQFALDGVWTYLFTDADDMPASFVPDAPLAHWSDIHAIHQRLATLQNAVTALAAAR